MVRSSLLGKLTIFIMLMVPVLLSAQTRFYAKTDAREVLSNSYIQVEFVLENGSGSNFTPPDFSPLTVVSGPSTSSQISIINGRRSQKKSYGFTLLAAKEGTYTIGSASIRVGRKNLTSDPLEIKVVKRRSATGKGNVEDVFVRAEISDSIVYPGQQILLKYVLYTNKRVSGYNYLSNPTYDGFYTQEIDSRGQSVRQVINGQEYNTQVFKTIGLFPQKTGDLYIEPLQLSIGIAQRNDPFSSFFNRTKQIPLTTNDHWVEVVPLPDGAPSDYNGAIGKYRMLARLDQQRATTDDALSLKLYIEGNGLAKFINAPELGLDDRFEVYDPRVLEEQSYVTNDEVVSKKTFEYLLVPRKAGRYDFKVSFTYFDTDSSEYRTLESQDFVVNITPGTNNAKGLTPEEILEKYQLRPMMTDTRLREQSNYFFGSPLFYLLLGILILCMPVMWFWRQYQIRQGKIDPADIKRRKAAKEASRRLVQAKNRMESGDSKSFYKAISDALEKYITDKFSIPTADLSKENIRIKLLDLEVEESLVEEYFAILNQCELSLFGGVSVTANQEIFQKADQLMQKMWLNLEKKS